MNLWWPEALDFEAGCIFNRTGNAGYNGAGTRVSDAAFRTELPSLLPPARTYIPTAPCLPATCPKGLSPLPLKGSPAVALFTLSFLVLFWWVFSAAERRGSFPKRRASPSPLRPCDRRSLVSGSLWAKWTLPLCVSYTNTSLTTENRGAWKTASGPTADYFTKFASFTGSNRDCFHRASEAHGRHYTVIFSSLLLFFPPPVPPSGGPLPLAPTPLTLREGPLAAGQSCWHLVHPEDEGGGGGRAEAGEGTTSTLAKLRIPLPPGSPTSILATQVWTQGCRHPRLPPPYLR